MTKIGLVLGAGGLVGQAFESGVLAALENDLGWDPRTADCLVGTSAGSLTASLLRTGIPALDLACWSRGSRLETTADVFDQLDHFLRQLPNPSVRSLLAPWHLPRPEAVACAVKGWRSLHLLPIAASMLPSGHTSLLDLLQADPMAWASQAWPEGLWICAVRRADGRRIVFGKEDNPHLTVPQAVAASSAIPGHFASVIVDGIEYSDGGLYSPTNADLLADEDLDLVVIVSPMSGGSGPADAMVRAVARHHLRAEIAQLERAGKEVVLFEPSHRVARLMGLNLMARERAVRVLSAAFFESGATAVQPRIWELLAPLRRPHTASHVA